MADDTRARLRSTTPAAYRWWRHVALIAAFLVGVVVLCLANLDEVRPLEWSATAAILLLILFGEWASHRYTMHRRVFPKAIHHRHVVEHHVFFAERMEIDAPEDLRWVLFPPWALPLLVLSVSPYYAALYWMGATNLAWLFLLVVVGYYGVYEIFHALTHLQPGEGIAGRLHAAVSRHHRVHHDPALMDRWNFNFALPLFDWLFGTIYRRADSAEAVDGEEVRPVQRRA